MVAKFRLEYQAMVQLPGNLSHYFWGFISLSSPVATPQNQDRITCIQWTVNEIEQSEFCWIILNRALFDVNKIEEGPIDLDQWWLCLKESWWGMIELDLVQNEQDQISLDLDASVWPEVIGIDWNIESIWSDKRWMYQVFWIW